MADDLEDEWWDEETTEIDNLAKEESKLGLIINRIIFSFLYSFNRTR